jgi:hypothetical protein
VAEGAKGEWAVSNDEREDLGETMAVDAGVDVESAREGSLVSLMYWLNASTSKVLSPPLTVVWGRASKWVNALKSKPKSSNVGLTLDGSTIYGSVDGGKAKPKAGWGACGAIVAVDMMRCGRGRWCGVEARDVPWYRIDGSQVANTGCWAGVVGTG